MIKKYIETLNGMQEVELTYNDEILFHSTEQVVVEMGEGDVLVNYVSDNPDSVGFMPNVDSTIPRGTLKQHFLFNTPPVVIKFGDVQSVTSLIGVLLRIERAMTEKQ